MYLMAGRVRYSEVGLDGGLTLHHLINYFQDCSTFHLEDIGLGLDYFQSQNLAFFILSWQIEINRLPKESEKIKVGTQIYECKGCFGYRNYVLYDETDNVLAYANLGGVFMDTISESFAKLSTEEIAKYPIEEKFEMEYLPRKIKAPKATDTFAKVTIRPCQIDTNGHVNNSHYVALALECLPQELEIKRVRVEYKKAAKCGDIMIPASVSLDGVYYVSLNDEEGHPYAILSFNE